MEQADPKRLASVPLFEGLSEEQLQKIASWLTVEEFEAGRMPIHNAAHGYAFFVLHEGRAHAEADGEVLEAYEPGAVFGEMAFFAPNSRRNANVVADTRISVLSMFGTNFREMQQEMPDVASRLQRLTEERSARTHPRQEDS